MMGRVTILNNPKQVGCSLSDKKGASYFSSWHLSSVRKFGRNPGRNPCATLRVYNSAGALITTLLSNACQRPLNNNIVWNGKNSAGAIVPAGAYTYKMWISDSASNNAIPYPATGTVTVQ